MLMLDFPDYYDFISVLNYTNWFVSSILDAAKEEIA